MAKTNDKLTGKVNVRFEDGDLGVRKPTVYAFMFKEERQVQSIDGSGNMNYTASFFDVEPVGDSAKDKKAGEQLARALQTVKIAYTMSPRGDVTNFDVKVPDDIKESKEGKQMERQIGYVRLIAQWVYGADRGPQFDPSHIEAGKSWPIRASIPTPTGGSKNWDMTCTPLLHVGMWSAEVTLDGRKLRRCSLHPLLVGSQLVAAGTTAIVTELVPRPLPETGTESGAEPTRGES